MNSYFLIYLFCIVTCIFMGRKIFLKNKNLSGFFFYCFSIFASSWCGLYSLFFLFDNKEYLLHISRWAFASWILCVYNLLFFLKYFNHPKEKILWKKSLFIFLGYTLIVFIYLFTNWMIEWLEYDSIKNVYREIYGTYYTVTLWLYIIFLIGFVFYATKQIFKQKWLNKIRIQAIVISTSILIFSLIILQLILPYFGIWIFEKEIIFLFLFYIIFNYYAFHRYYFTSLWYGIGQSFVIVLTFILSILLVFTGEYFLTIYTAESEYWKWGDQKNIIGVLLGIFFFHGFYKILHPFFLGNRKSLKLKEAIQKITRYLATTYDIDTISQYLETEFKTLLKTKKLSLHINNIHGELTALEGFFDKKNGESIFMNDIVFIENYTHICEMEKVVSEIPKNIFLVLPLYDNAEVTKWFLFFGYKLLGEIYTESEIYTLKEFAFFLGLRIQSIEMYQKIEDLSINLDKKVDEKTIEFNDLINKQKEFIGMISHEIKTPIASTILQADSIVDDIQNNQISPREINRELKILQEQLLNIGDLMNKLFSVEYYDTRSITLFREQIDMKDFLLQEIKIYKKIYPDILFEIDIWKTVGFLWIDRIQFQQILNNIISNARKQLQKIWSPKITFRAMQNKDEFCLEIKDNGGGFVGIKPEEVFDRYRTGGLGTAGLGLGLYLCKVIIEMHDGKIEAHQYKKNEWAIFRMTIPIKNESE